MVGCGSMSGKCRVATTPTATNTACLATDTTAKGWQNDTDSKAFRPPASLSVLDVGREGNLPELLVPSLQPCGNQHGTAA